MLNTLHLKEQIPYNIFAHLFSENVMLSKLAAILQ